MGKTSVLILNPTFCFYEHPYEGPPKGALVRWTSGIEVTVTVFWLIFCVILLQKITLPFTSLTLTPLLSNFVPSQISKCFLQTICTESTSQTFAFLVTFNHCNTPRSMSEIYSTIGQGQSLEILCFIRVEVYSIFWFTTFFKFFIHSPQIFVWLCAWSHLLSPLLPLGLEDQEISRVFCTLLQGRWCCW